MNRSPLVRALLVSVALGAAVALSGCNTDGLGVLPMSEKAARPLSDKMVKEIQSKNMDMESPILVRVFKEESELEVWKQDREGRFALLEDLSDLPLVRRAWPQDQGRRPPGAGGLLQHHPRPDESELAILSVVRSRLSERL